MKGKIVGSILVTGFVSAESRASAAGRSLCEWSGHIPGTRLASVASDNPAAVSASFVDLITSVQPADAAFLVASAALILWGFIDRAAGPVRKVIPLAASAGLMLLACLPIFPLPFVIDAPILRHAYSAVRVSGDWNHPFLPYLLNKPAALLTFDPALLRIMPFIWATVESMLFVHIAGKRFGGRRAAVLTAVWMAASVRISCGVVDLSDWNLAGIFLALMVIHCGRSEGAGSNRWGWLATYVVPSLLMMLGTASSWLMFVPAWVFGFVLLVDCLMRSSYRPMIPVAVTLLMLTLLAFKVFSTGTSSMVSTGDLPWRPFLVGMVGTAPVGVAPIMPFVLAAGFLMAFRAIIRRDVLFCVLVVPAVVLAVIVARQFSTVNGAYYISLIHGPAIVIAAWFVSESAAGIDRAIRAASGLAHRIGPAAAGLAVGAVLVVSGVRLEREPFNTTPRGTGCMPEFVELLGSDPVPVFSNMPDIVNLLEYREVRLGRLTFEQMIDPYLTYWTRTVVRPPVTADGRCPDIPERFAVVQNRQDASLNDALPSCWDSNAFSCRELFQVKSGNSGVPPILAEDMNRVRLLDCRRVEVAPATER